MDSDEDIRILQNCDPPGASEGDSESHFIVPFSPLSPTSPFTFDQGSHHALQKAYTELKRRLNESNSKNQHLNRRIQELESSPGSGQWCGVMDDAGVSTQGAAGLQLAAEEGYANNLQRQLVRAKTQLQLVEKKFQEKVQETDSQVGDLSLQLREACGQVDLLQQEKTTLKQLLSEEMREKEATLHSLEDMRKKCDSLEVEKDKVMKEVSALQLSLQKAEQEIALLKESQGETIQPEAREVAREVAHMRKVIASLKAMVLDQKDRLTSRGAAVSMTPGQGMSLSMQSTLSRLSRDPTSVGSGSVGSALNSSHSGGSRSGHSWEMVSSALPPPLHPHQQQQQQLREMQQRLVSSASTGWSAGAGPQGVAAHSVIGQEAAAGEAAVTNLPPYRYRGSRTMVMERRVSQDVVSQPRSKTEILRSHTAPAAGPSLDWVDSGLTPLQGSGAPLSSQSGAGLTSQSGAGLSSQSAAHTLLLQHSENGLSQSQLEQVSPRDSAPGVAAPPGVLSPASPHLPLREPSGAYDNVTSDHRTVPSMHIVNQSGMAGARVLRNSADSFASGGGRNLTGTSPLPGLSGGVDRDRTAPVSQMLGLSDNLHRGTMATSPHYNAVNMDWKASRGVAQEHDEVTQFRNTATLEVNQLSQTQDGSEPLISQAGAVLDRKCPVCGMDFSQVSMDEFQTHVFECFDDAEDASMAPETLQPQQSTEEKVQSAASRVCPMCTKQFGENTSQQFFEGHVQSHFEQVADQFEVLDVHKT